MTHTHDDAKKALTFARQHDWGCNARITGDRLRGFCIDGLRDISKDNQGTHVSTTRVPATLKDVRQFGGY